MEVSSKELIACHKLSETVSKVMPEDKLAQVSQSKQTLKNRHNFKDRQIP